MIRPEIKDGLWRWREVIAALAFAGLGMWFALSAFGIMEWVGWAIFALGVAVAVSAAQKVRFQSQGDGPGVVTIDERRVTYLGPLDGGIVELDLMVQLDLTPNDAWHLINADGTYIDIPTNAKGVDVLFDVFIALPGIKTEYMLSILNRADPTRMTVWMAPDHKPYKVLH